MTRTPIILFLGIFIIFQTPIAQSFDTPTHSQLSNRAVLSSNVDNFLKTELNFPGGVQDPVLNGVTRSIIEWVQEGSIREDDSPRFCNHFHNPLRSWNQAGLQIFLNPVCPTTNTSSVLWGQRPDFQSQNENEQFAWQNARQRYFDGLTASTKADRDQKLALTFETLGHLIHLVQDAAVPAHTRNDTHPTFIDPDGFESFVDSIRTRLFNQLTSASISYDPSILKLTTASSAPIPIARIIDTTDSDQVAADPSAGTDIGIAEYSNANFLSNDTIFRDFVFPRVESLGLPFRFRGDTYFPKVADGELIDHFVAQDRRGNYFLSERGRPKAVIFTDYASKLLPRAIGYSAGLIDYFSRGRMEVVLSEDQPSETSVLVKVRNTTPDENTMNKPGEIVGVLRYLLSGQEFFSVSELRQLTLTSDFQELVFNLIPPDGAEEAFLAVVYKGQLGLEEQAVMQGKTPLMILKPKNPTLACPDGSVTFTATGGRLPYTWSTTKGVITPSTDTKSAVLVPPANTGSGVAGNAYERYGRGVGWINGACQITSSKLHDYGCNDQILFTFSSPGCLTPAQPECPIGTPSCGPLIICDSDALTQANCPQCAGLPTIYTEAALKLGSLCDRRTQAMIAAGCKLCAVEMQGGATVTVTDTAGGSVSTTVTVQ